MKALTLLFVALGFHLTSYSQSHVRSPLTPYFNAIIVNNMDTSLNWYQKVLGYEVLNNKQFPDMGFKQANLSNGQTNLELIELNAAIAVKDVVPNYNPKTKIKGLFKFGFQVDEFDAWVQHLESLKVQFNGRVVSDELTKKRMVIIQDPDGNRVQLFER